MSEGKVGDALTEKAIKAYSQIEAPRLRELTVGLIRHLHAFVKESKPTDQEFEIAWALMAKMAKFTGDDRNEFSSAPSSEPMLPGGIGANPSSATTLKENGFALA
jgi:hypothetical protein